MTLTGSQAQGASKKACDQPIQRLELITSSPTPSAPCSVKPSRRLLVPFRDCELGRQHEAQQAKMHPVRGLDVVVCECPDQVVNDQRQRIVLVVIAAGGHCAGKFQDDAERPIS